MDAYLIAIKDLKEKLANTDEVVPDSEQHIGWNCGERRCATRLRRSGGGNVASAVLTDAGRGGDVAASWVHFPG